AASTRSAAQAIGTAAIGVALVVIRSAVLAVAVAVVVREAAVPERTTVRARQQRAIWILAIDQAVTVVIPAVAAGRLGFLQARAIRIRPIGQPVAVVVDAVHTIGLAPRRAAGERPGAAHSHGAGVVR